MTGSRASKKASKLFWRRFSLLNTGFSTCTCTSSRRRLDSRVSEEEERPRRPRGMCSLGRRRDLLVGDLRPPAPLPMPLLLDGRSGGRSMGDMGRPQPGPKWACVGSGVGGSTKMLGLRERGASANAEPEPEP